MFWFLSSATLLLLFALVICFMGLPRRRVIEAVTLLVILLPLLSMGLDALVPTQIRIAWSIALQDAPWTVPFFPLALIALWASGFAVQVVILISRWRGVGRLRVTSSVLSNESLAMISSCLRQPEYLVRQCFRISESVKTPLVLPGINCLVLLPMNWDSWPLRLRSGALRHEWHHLVHHDAIWNVWMSLFRAVFWFHPLAWLAVHVWSDACENDADIVAVDGNDPADYAQDLLGIVSLQQFAISGATCFLGPSRVGLQRRILLLLSTQPVRVAEKPFVLKVAGPVLILGLTLICACMGVRKGAADLGEARLRLEAIAFPADQ